MRKKSWPFIVIILLMRQVTVSQALYVELWMTLSVLRGMSFEEMDCLDVLPMAS